jgi:hypothetical protein
MTGRPLTEYGVRRVLRQKIGPIDVSAVGLVVPENSVDKATSIRGILDNARQQQGAG